MPDVRVLAPPNDYVCEHAWRSQTQPIYPSTQKKTALLLLASFVLCGSEYLTNVSGHVGVSKMKVKVGGRKAGDRIRRKKQMTLKKRSQGGSPDD